MTIVKSRPTSPGRRFRVKITNSELYKGQPHEPLLTKLIRVVAEITKEG